MPIRQQQFVALFVKLLAAKGDWTVNIPLTFTARSVTVRAVVYGVGIAGAAYRIETNLIPSRTLCVTNDLGAENVDFKHFISSGMVAGEYFFKPIVMSTGAIDPLAEFTLFLEFNE